MWSPLIAEPGRGAISRLSPPGFAAPLPRDFGCTVREYRDWLIGELERFDAPVDLVGHDWGGCHVVNVAMARPGLLHSWASDTLGIFDPEYVWHDLARGWQTTGVGEGSVARLLGGPAEDRAAFLLGRGIPRPVAERLAAADDEAMGRAILALYRSAAQPTMAELGGDLPAAARRPGLCILATEEANVGSDAMRRRSAARSGAREGTRRAGPLVAGGGTGARGAGARGVLGRRGRGGGRLTTASDMMERMDKNMREEFAMSSREPGPEAIAVAAAIPHEQPFVMLNLLRYREQADYGDRTDETPCSGREAYHGRYIPAFGAVAPAGIRLFWYGGVVAHLAGPTDERWDEVALVRDPSSAHFRRVVGDPRYLAAADPHRRAALADFRLIAITEAS